MYSFPNLEPICCSMSGSNCCFLTCTQISQEAGKLVSLRIFHSKNSKARTVARIKQCCNREQIANIWWIMETAREFQKNIYFCFVDYAKAFDFAHHNKLWKILKEMGIPDPPDLPLEKPICMSRSNS